MCMEKKVLRKSVNSVIGISPHGEFVAIKIVQEEENLQKMVMNVMDGKMEKPGFVMMIGLPGSGKSYFSNIYSNNLKNMGIPNIILSSDKIRKELYGDESIQDDPDKVFQIMEERTINNLKNNISVVYDATNINYKNRMNLLKKLPDCWKIALIIWTPYQMCLERNKNRERIVPENAIKKMYKKNRKNQLKNKGG